LSYLYVTSAVTPETNFTIFVTLNTTFTFTCILPCVLFCFITEDGIHRFQLWLENNSSINSTGSDAESIDKMMELLRSIQTISSLRPVDRVIIYIGSVMTNEIIINNEIVKNLKMLIALAPTAQTQRHVISAFEWYCGSKYPSLLISKFPIILKTLFDEEIVEEDVFFDWATDYAKNDYSADSSLISIETLEELKLKSQPFITWLREADESGEDDDDDEDDEDDEED